MEASMMVQIDRTSSIDKEPRTLSMQQMQSARDLAIFVLSTNTMEEASRIFTQGLEPVVNTGCDRRNMVYMEVDEEEEMDIDLNDDAAAFRDIASAPF